MVIEIKIIMNPKEMQNLLQNYNFKFNDLHLQSKIYTRGF